MVYYIIYLATCLANEKQYVGQTKSWRLNRRVKEHLRDAAIKDKNVAFHNAINKYGIENFKFEIIETDILEENIDERERYWIAYYNTYIHAENSNGYNETLGGQGTHGYIFTDEDKQKISQKQKAYWADLKENNQDEYERLCEIRRQNKLGKKWTDESRQKLSESCKGRVPWNKDAVGLQEAWNKGISVLPAICQYDFETGKLLNKFSTTTIAAESLNLPNISTVATRIFAVVQANKGHAYNYIWRFDTDRIQLSENELLLEHKSPRAKSIQQFDLDNNFIAEYESAAAYSKTISSDYKKQRSIAKTINETCKGKHKTYKGFIWRYTEE